jgi:hypothetical protein
MKWAIPKPKTLLILAAFLITLIASRTFNLDKTARFIWDESSDLVNMHQIYVEKKLTLIGPVSEDGSKVFGSLTYYMLLPFAIAGNFDPVSTAYGAAFWGVATGILILLLAYKVNKKVVAFIIPLVIIWYPLVETGRWAWNPNLIPFWVTLGLLFFFRKGALFKFLSGLTIGLSIHLHYLVLFACMGLGMVVLIEAIKEKHLKSFFAFAAGVMLAILPFAIFDLTHPPGLFLSRVLHFNNLAGVGGNLPIFENLLRVSTGFLQYFTQSVPLEITLTLFLILLLAIDLKERSQSLYFFGIFLVQIIGVSFVTNFYPHYILPALLFFIVYLIYPRKSADKILSYLVLTILIVSGLFSFPKQITNTAWESDITSTRFIANTVSDEIVRDNLKNNNIAVLGSPDPNTYGRKYRDLLLIKGMILKTKGEYETSDHLFVITTTTLEAVRKDPSYEIKFFKSGKLIKSWDVPGSSWKIFLLSRTTSLACR